MKLLKRLMRLTVLPLIGILVIMLDTGSAISHDEWINKGGYRNQANEWCCGANDCDLIPLNKVSTNESGYVLFDYKEIVPYSEAQPSPDGAYWRCHRADGSRRCFFAPPPNT